MIRLGTSGGIQPTVKPGTMAISTYAIGLDSTGLFYDHVIDDPLIEKIEQECLRLLHQSTPDHARFKGKIVPYVSKADTTVIQQLQIACDQLRLPYEMGMTVSSSGFYGPSGRYLQGLKNTGSQYQINIVRTGDGKSTYHKYGNGVPA